MWVGVVMGCGFFLEVAVDVRGGGGRIEVRYRGVWVFSIFWFIFWGLKGGRLGSRVYGSWI